MTAPAVEKIRGINEPLPPGECVLWQGAPDWRALARDALHIRLVAAYFALLLAWQVGAALAAGRTVESTLAGTSVVLTLAAIALGLLAGFAWLAARTTIYAITTQRTVMRVGVAMPIFVNIPHTGVDNAELKLLSGDRGDIPLTLKADVRLAYLHLWPHVRPWQVAHPQPMLRALPQARQVATLLAEQLACTGGTSSAPAAPSRPAIASNSASGAHAGASVAA